MASPPPRNKSALQAWTDKEHAFRYPKSDAKIPDNLSTSNLIGRSWDKDAFLASLKKMEKQKKQLIKDGNNKWKFPIRTEQAKLPADNQRTILTNHFEI
jgi:hypothetical protein